jgi:acetyl esterase
LIYPAIDARCRTRSHQENAQGYYLTRETINYFSGHYLSSPSDYEDWRASPILHPDLSRLPRSLVLTAGFDPLRDEGAEYAQRLGAAGSPGSYVCFSRQIHGFVPMGKLIDEANTAVALCAAEMRRVLCPRS